MPPTGPPSMPPSLPPTGPPSGATSAQASRLVAPIPTGGGPDGTRMMAATPDTAMAPQVREQRARTVARQAPTRRLQPGDLVCGDCGEGNPPNRKFCSRCGTSLETAVAVKTPWWRKLLPRRKAKVLDAGARPGRGGVRTRSRRATALAKIFPTIRKVIAVVVLLSGVVYGAYAPFRAWTNDKVIAGKNKVTHLINPKFDPVHPNGVKSTTPPVKGHDAGMAIDGFKNTWWQTATPLAGRDHVEVVLTLRFAGKVDVDKALFTSGAHDNFQSTNRPQKVHLVYDTGATFDLTLTDSPEPQEVNLGNGHGITTLEIHFITFFRSVHSVDVALTEVELFQKE
jgi:hypothetical protein